MDWIIFYGEHDKPPTFSSDDGAWEDAPAWGIQAIVYRNIETGWSVVTTGDYYIRLDDGSFLPLGEDALLDYVANVWKVAKVGRMVSRGEFARVHGQALEMMGDLKTGYYRNERRPD